MKHETLSRNLLDVQTIISLIHCVKSEKYLIFNDVWCDGAFDFSPNHPLFV